jgi:sec-independent protein translocase protein TatC
MAEEEIDAQQDGIQEESEMTFWGHLEALRWHIIRSVSAVFVFAIAAFLNKDIIFKTIILAPKSSEFITNKLLCRLSEFLSLPSLCIGNFDLKLINIQMAGQFMIHMYISAFAGLIVAIPYVLWEIWRFVKPALHENEAHHASGAVFFSSLLFLVGVLFSYFLIVPMAVLFLGSYTVSESVENQVALSSYISTVVSLTFSVGVVFELPILVFFLTKVGMITPMLMRRNRKFMIVVVLIVAAIITPPDVFSQLLVTFPLLGLYELSILVSARVYKRRSQEISG